MKLSSRLLLFMCIGFLSTLSIIECKKVDFFDSMEWDAEKNREAKDTTFSPSLVWPEGSTGNQALKTMLFFKDLYERNNFFIRPAVYETKIPKRIHQIWFGPKTPPSIFKESQESLKKHHPDWEYKLWTEEDIPSLHLENQEFYDLSQNYAEKADIVRYELLNKFGGVYVDIDFVCLKPFDVLTQYDFWAGIESLDCQNRWVLSNAIIGAVPHHPILRHCIETIPTSWYKIPDTFLRVGPAHLSESVIASTPQDSTTVIIFPKSFFYSLDFKDGLAARNDNLHQASITSQIRPESFAMHYWAGTWWRKTVSSNMSVTSADESPSSRKRQTWARESEAWQRKMARKKYKKLLSKLYRQKQKKGSSKVYSSRKTLLRVWKRTKNRIR
ncbi:hypothetical protein H0W26_02065 [Candidatus Dependentiae bacterium]|nr:hypothetical protein [Candidatus Dependentiae bacterium]